MAQAAVETASAPPREARVHSDSAAVPNDTDQRAAPVPKRFDGLDGVRATAMLLGVFYHLPIAMYTGGGFMGFGAPHPKTTIDNWLHSYRMPLFFLISGFFANMMLQKYGWKQFYLRRYWRIGAPFVVAFLLLVGVRFATAYFRPAGASPFGFPPTFGPPPQTNAPAGNANLLQVPGGTATPPQNAGPPPNPFGPPRFGGGNPFGPPPGTGGNPVRPPGAGAPGGFGPPPSPPTGTNAATPPVFPRMNFPSRAWSEKLFGQNSRHLNLEHLWFLWYLLIFVTIAPPIVKLLSLPWRSSVAAVGDLIGGFLVHWNLFAILLGLITLPPLLHARGFMGWSLANPHGFLGAFPDFLVQYYPDQPYYFLYFLAGWWLYRMRRNLPDLASCWLWNLTLGVIGFAVSQNLATRYAMQTDAPYYDWIRLGGFALYGVGAAFSACGLIGLFQKYADQPSKFGRYLADTALWIYLVHLPLIPYLIWWVQPANGSWWISSLGGMIVVTGVSLVLFELLIRPTPLVRIFGPPLPKKTGL